MSGMMTCPLSTIGDPSEIDSVETKSGLPVASSNATRLVHGVGVDHAVGDRGRADVRAVEDVREPRLGAGAGVQAPGRRCSLPPACQEHHVVVVASELNAGSDRLAQILAPVVPFRSHSWCPESRSRPRIPRHSRCRVFRPRARPASSSSSRSSRCCGHCIRSATVVGDVHIGRGQRMASRECSTRGRVSS